MHTQDCGVNANLKASIADLYATWRARHPTVNVGVAEKNHFISTGYTRIPAEVVRSAWKRTGLVPYTLPEKAGGDMGGPLSLVTTSTAAIPATPSSLPSNASSLHLQGAKSLQWKCGTS
jgi:hypothetical protein